MGKNFNFDESNNLDCIFISYQHNSLESVLKISEYLESRGIKTWYAPRDIEEDVESEENISDVDKKLKWPGSVADAIDECKVLLLLYTEDADDSKHVCREVVLADDANKPILWLKLDNSKPTRTLKYFLAIIQAIKWNGKDEKTLNILFNILNKKKITTESLFKDENIETSKTTQDLPVTNDKNKLISFKSAYEAAECAARVYFEVANKNPNSTVLLPTGRSARELFAAMLRSACEYDKPFGDAKIMNDTETYGVFPKHKTSRIKGINYNLMNPLKAMGKAPDSSQLTYFKGVDEERDPEDIALENLTKNPVSITGVSVSPYFEIIGYDLGSYDNDITKDNPRVIAVNDDTKNYIDPNQKVNSIYTVGLKAILNSQILLIFAFTKDKAPAISRLFREDIDPKLPITLLRNHPNAYVFITDEVAKEANLEEHAMKPKNIEEALKCILKQ